MAEITKTQTGLVVFVDHDGTSGIEIVDFEVGSQWDDRTVTLLNGDVFESTDYDTNVDIHYSPSDDGKVWYNPFAVIPPDRVEEVRALDWRTLSQEVTAIAFPKLTALYANEGMASDDLDYARLMMRTPSSIVSLFLKHGPHPTEIARVITGIWGIQ